MKKLGLPVFEFPIMEEISIAECSEIEEIFEEVGRGEGEASIMSLPKLRRLHLECLPKLKSMCNNATTTCTSTEHIRLSECPDLKKFPLAIVPPPPSLERLWIYEQDWASMEWEDPTHPLLLHPFLEYLFEEIYFGTSETESINGETHSESSINIRETESGGDDE